MPKTTNIGKYPSGMLDLLESICATHHLATIAYPTAKAAQAARFDFYGLIRALEHHEHSIALVARQLRFVILATAENPKDKRILQIEFPERIVDANFYTTIAKMHEEDAAKHGTPAPTPVVKLDKLLDAAGIHSPKPDLSDAAEDARLAREREARNKVD